MSTMVSISPTPIQRFVDSNGNALAGGLLFTYQAGTTTKYPTYTDSSGNTQNTNPIVLNQRGEASIWLVPTQSYKFVLAPANDTDPPQSPIWTEDHIQASAAVAVGNMTDELGSDGNPGFKAGTDFTPGTTTSLTLANTYGSTANLWVAFDAAEQGADSFTLSGTTLTFNAPIPNGTNKVYVKGGTALTVGTPANETVVDASVAPNAAIKSTKLSYLEGDVGSVARTVQNKLKERISVKDFGAKGDGTTDDSTAFQNALNALQTLGGGALYIPASPSGYVLDASLSFSMPSTTAGLSIIGEGSSVTVLKFRGNIDGLTVAMNGPFTAVQMSGFSITTNSANVKSAITIAQNVVAVPDPANVAESRLSDIMIYGEGGYGSGHLNCWLNGVVVQGASNINFETVYVMGGASASYPNTGGAAFNISGTATDIPVVFNFIDCVANLMGSGVLMGSYVQGVQIANCNFTGCFYGVHAPGTAVDLVQLCIANCQFNCQSGIQCDSPVQGLIITNNFFLFPSSSTAIQLTQTSLSIIANNTFEPTSFPATNSNGILIQNTVASGISATIAGNIFVNVPSTCILLDTTSKYCNVSDNSFYGTSAFQVFNNGLFNRIQPNQIGLVPSATQVPPTPALPASGAAYTNNTGFSCRVFISGGTFTSVSLNGVAMAASANWFGEVQPMETISIAYTVAPAWTWVGK